MTSGETWMVKGKEDTLRCYPFGRLVNSIAMPDRIAKMNDAANTVQEAARYFRINGCLELESCFEPGLVRAMQEEFLQNYASRDRLEVEKSCLKVGEERYMFSIDLSGPFLDPGIYAAPGVLPIVQELLGDDCIIQSYGVVCAYPGAPFQHVHRDHAPLFAEAGGLNAFLPPFALHVVIPLVDLDERTGTTALWEGSHRIKSSQQEQHYSKAQLERLEGAILPTPKIGDCYFMDYRLRHTGTANHSDRPRPILYIVYSRPWFLDRRNYDIQSPLQISRDAFEQIPDEHRNLFRTAGPEGS